MNWWKLARIVAFIAVFRVTGLTIDTWQFWALFVLVAAVGLTSAGEREFELRKRVGK